jgi:hypothetical protein
MGKNILIYGSCVSRDAFEGFGEEYNLLAYVARQSLVSAMTPGTRLLDGDALDSKFQNRSLRGDLSSNLVPTVKRFAPDVDLVLMDLTDERLGVMKLPDSTYITHSHELLSSGRLASLRRTPKRIDFATDEHFLLWSVAATQFSQSLQEMGLLEKTLIINAHWATHTESGELVPSFRLPTHEMNDAFPRYFDHLRGLGFQVFDLPREASVSLDDHKWGAAPYHFGQLANTFIAEAVIAAME